MHRLMTALMALVSLLAANLYPARAQQPDGEHALITAVGQPMPGADAASERALRPLPMDADMVREKGRQPSYELGIDQTLPHLIARDKNLIFAGHVTGDVLTINCHVIIKPGASVGNSFVAVGGDVADENQGRIRVTRLDGALANELLSAPAVSGAMPVVGASSALPIISPKLATAPSVAHPADTPHHDKPKQDWAGGQFALLLLGGLAGLLTLIVAPRATERAGETLTREPGRCLVVGALGAGLMLVGLWFSSGLMRSPFHFVWMPFNAGFAGLSLGALAFGWICGMRLVGQRVSRRLGRGGTIFGMWIQIVCGLTAFFLANAFLGRLSQGFGAVGLLLEFALALAGLGAALLTGFGSDPNWLTARMRGETRWLSRSRD